MSGAAGARRSLRTNQVPDETPSQKGQPPVGRAALFGLCPECGARTLFTGAATFAPRCRACGLDFGRYNVGDVPPAFLTLIIGALMLAVPLAFDFAFEPAPWALVVLGGAVIGVVGEGG